jgi:NAD+ kinase
MRTAARPIRMGVVGHPGYDELPGAMETLRQLAPGLNMELRIEDGLVPDGDDPRLESADDLDVLVTLGGDGTLLRGARLLGTRDVPILGVNMGRLGFLTCCPADQLSHSLMRFARGDYTIESRMALRASVVGKSGERDTWIALNDCVVHKGGFARVVPFRVLVNDETIGLYSADGVVISTPTGSTAYSLSAGGPVVVPTLEALMVTPVSPHTLAVRPVVCAGDSRICVRAEDDIEELMITVDGQVGGKFSRGETLNVSRSPHAIKIVRFPGTTFFATLRQKLGWGGIPERDQSRNADRAAR